MKFLLSFGRNTDNHFLSQGHKNMQEHNLISWQSHCFLSNTANYSINNTLEYYDLHLNSLTLKVCWAFLLNYIEALKMAYFLVFYLTGLIHVICFIKAPVIYIQVWNRNNKNILATCIALDWFINVFLLFTQI